MLGVSVLDEKSKAKFAKKHALDVSAAGRCRPRRRRAYGAWQEKTMYGSKYMGVARITYLMAQTAKC